VQYHQHLRQSAQSNGHDPLAGTIKEAPSFAEFPLYNADIQNASGSNTLADAIRAADRVIFCTPEYNFSLPAD
jgi:NAD(P)H-dependent FMN reductase